MPVASRLAASANTIARLSARLSAKPVSAAIGVVGVASELAGLDVRAGVGAFNVSAVCGEDVVLPRRPMRILPKIAQPKNATTKRSRMRRYGYLDCCGATGGGAPVYRAPHLWQNWSLRLFCAPQLGQNLAGDSCIWGRILLTKNMRRLKFGGDCLPLSGCRVRKFVNRKSNAERWGNATPGGVDVSISRNDLAVAVSASANEGQKLRHPANSSSPLG